MTQMKKHKKHLMGKGEFLFNIISICSLIALCLYFGIRSMYYYSKQNQKLEKESQTLAGMIHSKYKVTSEKDGLHQTKDAYIFKGNVEYNYVIFAGRLFRIMEVDNDNSVKLVSQDNQALFLWGDESDYKTSNVYHWLNKTEKSHSGIYYNSIPGAQQLLENIEWCDATLTDEKVRCDKERESSLFSILTVEDYINSNGKDSYLVNEQYSYLLGHDQEQGNLIVDEDGEISSVSNYEGYGIRVVLKLKNNIKVVGGDGSVDHPYVINQEGHINYINHYVTLGDDNYLVYEDKNGILRLALNDYIKEGTGQYVGMFSNKNAIFDSSYKYNIAYYLNNIYYNNLAYKDYLIDCDHYIGEISNETGLDYEIIYQNIVKEKIGLLNLYDLNLNQRISDFYLVNTTSTKGMMGFVYHHKGVLNEDKITEDKHVIPTICMNANSIKSGSGSLDDPFRVE